MSYQIKHMGLGGILDQAIAIIRNHFVLLFNINLFVLIPATLVLGYVALSAAPELPENPTYEDVMQANREQMENLPWLFAISALTGLFVYPVTNAAVIQAISRLYLGEPVTATEAMKHGLRRLLPLWGTNILRYLAIYAGFLLLVVPGIYFAIWFALAQQVVVIENIAGTKALKRSKALVHKDRGVCLALAIVVIVLTSLVGAGANFIPQPHLRVVASALIQALTAIIWSATFVVFYFSCRCNVENFDLQYLAEQIGAGTATEADDAVAPGRP
jgi:hypothetical protein